MPLKSTTTVAIPAFAAHLMPAPGAAGTVVLPVQYTSQEQTNWCWAACCQMVFRHAGTADRRQCEMATAQFGGQCCAAPGSTACNLGNWPENTYYHYGFNYTRRDTALSFAAVQAEIDAQRTVEIYYRWSDGNAHVALIVGYYGNGDVEVFDPWPSYGPGRRDFSYVRTAYGLGSWQISYTNLQR